MELEQFHNTPKGQRGFIWILDNVIELIRNDSRNTDNYATKHDLLFGELAYLLNEGYCTVELETYSLPIFEDRNNKFNELYEQLGGSLEKDAALEAITQSSKYFDDVFMQYALWEKLYTAGARAVNFNHKPCAMFATDIQAMVTMGNVDIEFLFKALEKGIQNFYIAHYTRQTTAKVFILRPTTKLPLYFEEKKKEEYETNQFFSKIESSTATETYREIPLYEDEYLHQLDLVEFVHENKIYRGQVIYELTNGPLGYKTALQYVRDNTVKFPKAKFTIMFEQNDFLTNSVLIKRPMICEGQEEIEIYIVNKRNIKTLIPYDYLGWADQILCAFMWLNPGNTLNLDYLDTDETLNIHKLTVYEPDTHTLRVIVVNLIKYAIEQFFNYRIHPFDTFEKVLAHEVGHVDALVELVTHYNEVLKEVRGINRQINENIQIFKVDYEQYPDLVIETMMLIDEKINLLQDFYTDKLTDVKQGYENGLKYISTNLSYSYQKDALRAYQENKEKYSRQLYKLYNHRYTLENISRL